MGEPEVVVEDRGVAGGPVCHIGPKTAITLWPPSGPPRGSRAATGLPAREVGRAWGPCLCMAGENDPLDPRDPSYLLKKSPKLSIAPAFFGMDSRSMPAFSTTDLSISLSILT